MSAENVEASILLSNGVLMPKIGFGCAFGNLSDASKPILFTPEEGWYLIPTALQSGYRLLDGALMYGTHNVLGISLGKEIAEGRLKRSDVFVTTKLFHPPADVGFTRLGNAIDIAQYMADESLDIKERILGDFERCLHELNLGYVDLLLAHWPGAHGTTDSVSGDRVRFQMWQAFEEIYAMKRARAIGVSNFLVRHLQPMLSSCVVKPMVNQIELNPYITQNELVKFCREEGIAVQAWSPMGNGATGVVSDPVIIDIAAKYQKDPGQIILRWLVQQNFAALPKTSSKDRMRSNLQVFDFKLDGEDMMRISSLNKDQTWIATSDDIA